MAVIIFCTPKRKYAAELIDKAYDEQKKDRDWSAVGVYAISV
jgi:hypothetical protein